MVKLGRASEAALESAGAGAATDALVAAYALAPAPATALRTPQLQHDRVLLEAQNVMALTHVDTPLKGGLNTPLQVTTHRLYTFLLLPSQQTVAKFFLRFLSYRRLDNTL